MVGTGESDSKQVTLYVGDNCISSHPTTHTPVLFPQLSSSLVASSRAGVVERWGKRIQDWSHLNTLLAFGALNSHFSQPFKFSFQQDKKCEVCEMPRGTLVLN